MELTLEVSEWFVTSTSVISGCLSVRRQICLEVEWLQADWARRQCRSAAPVLVDDCAWHSTLRTVRHARVGLASASLNASGIE